jgi:septal ring factor EnvC (AmiA/AmiB activator)
MAPPLQAAGLFYYCWNNEDGVEECGNFVPPQHSQNGFKKCKRGKCEFVKPAPTPEEIAEIERQEEEKQKRQQQTNKDCQFLNTFSSITDIELARATARATIDAQKQPIEMLLDALKGNLEDQKKNYELSKMNPSVLPNQLNAILREIEAVKDSIAKQDRALQDKLKEQTQTQKNRISLIVKVC